MGQSMDCHVQTLDPSFCNNPQIGLFNAQIARHGVMTTLEPYNEDTIGTHSE